jgi:hypothetical protein
MSDVCRSNIDELDNRTSTDDVRRSVLFAVSTYYGKFASYIRSFDTGKTKCSTGCTVPLRSVYASRCCCDSSTRNEHIDERRAHVHAIYLVELANFIGSVDIGIVQGVFRYVEILIATSTTIAHHKFRLMCVRRRKIAA